jgi:glycosyltransferase involved in cell wall biosynthesis
MAVRDGAAYLPQAVESILAQTLGDFELIVVDDGSRDATPDILAEFARGDERLRILPGKPSGAGAARNRAGRQVRGRFLAAMDADDIALPSRLELQVEFLDSHPDVVVVGGAGMFIDEHGAELGVLEYVEADANVTELLNTGQSPVIHPAATMRTQAFRVASGYRTIFEVAYDYDLWLRMAGQGRITNIPQTVLGYRVHPGQVSTRNLRKTAEETCIALASARARARADPDPLDSVTSLDPTVMARLGIKPQEVAAREVHYALWLAGTLARGGRDDLANPLWSSAMRRAGATATARVTRARVLRARADACLSRPLSFGLRLMAAALDPKGVAARRHLARAGVGKRDS